VPCGQPRRVAHRAAVQALQQAGAALEPQVDPDLVEHPERVGDPVDQPPAQVHLTLPDAWRQRRFRVPVGVVLHHADVAPEERSWFGPVPATSASRTLSDCAKSGLSPERLRQAAQQSLRSPRLTNERSYSAQLSTRYRVLNFGWMRERFVFIPLSSRRAGHLATGTPLRPPIAPRRIHAPTRLSSWAQGTWPPSGSSSCRATRSAEGGSKNRPPAARHLCQRQPPVAPGRTCERCTDARGQVTANRLPRSTSNSKVPRI